MAFGVVIVPEPETICPSCGKAKAVDDRLLTNPTRNRAMSLDKMKVLEFTEDKVESPY